MSEIVLYYAPRTRAGAARWMLEETGVPYRVETLDMGAGEHRRAEYLKINPMGKVPAIKDGDVVVSENAAIALYLADAYPAAGLAPPIGDPARGRYLKWCVWAAGCLEPAMMQAYLKFEVERGTAGWGGPEIVVDVLADALREAPYLLGESFSAADVVVGSGLMSGMMFGLLPERPEFAAYRDRLNARPVRQRALAAEEEAAS
jgi:glutathione S-transferase